MTVTIEKIREKLKSEEYDFLRREKSLGNRVIFLALGGSHAYGMEQETSDLDVRGAALNAKEEILLGTDFDQIVDIGTDTTVYSFNKMIRLLTSNNPNTLEILGCKPEHYLYLSEIGRRLRENRKMFLSRVCIHTFGGYAQAQLRRMENAAARLAGQAEKEAYILKSIQNAAYDFKSRYYPHEEGDIRLYIDRAVQKGYDSEIFMDLHLQHYPLRDWTGMWNEMKAIVGSYNKNSARNEKAASHGKLGKHCAHLLRLYMMCIDILEKEEIITYREAEHDLLMRVRNGEFLDENRQPTPEFYDLVNGYEKRFEYAKENTSLPGEPDYNKIRQFQMEVNERIVKGEI